MARYQVCDESVQLVEAGQDKCEPQVQPKPKPWRRLGAGLIVMCTLGAVAFAQTRQRRVTPQEHLLKLHRKIIRAFERHLSDENDLSYDAHLGFSFTDESSSATPDHMGADLTWEKDAEHEDGDLVNYILLFEPAEGKLDDLEEGLNGILAEIKTMASQMDVPESAVDKLVSVFKADGRAGFKCTPPAEGEKRDKEVDEMAKELPTINGTIYFGRTLQEMYDAGDESLATVHGGFEVTTHVRLYRSMIEVISEDEEAAAVEMIEDEEMRARAQAGFNMQKRIPDKMAWLASIGGHISVKYRTDKFAEVEMPTIQSFMKKTVGGVCQSGGGKILEKVAALRHSVDSVHSLSIHGLQDNTGHRQLRLFFHNVHLTPLINDVRSTECSEEENSQ